MGSPLLSVLDYLRNDFGDFVHPHEYSGPELLQATPGSAALPRDDAGDDRPHDGTPAAHGGGLGSRTKQMPAWEPHPWFKHVTPDPTNGYNLIDLKWQRF